MLAATLLLHFVNARAVLLKESAELRAAAETRLAQFAGRYELAATAFSREPLPRGFEAVVTLMGLHRLDDIARRGVYGALVPDGAFLAAEWIRPPTHGVAATYADIHTREGRVAGAQAAPAVLVSCG